MWQKEIAVFIVPLISPFPFSIWSWLKDFILLLTESRECAERMISASNGANYV